MNECVRSANGGEGGGRAVLRGTSTAFCQAFSRSCLSTQGACDSSVGVQVV